MVDPILPKYHQMVKSKRFDRLLVNQRFDALIHFIKTKINSFEEHDRSLDRYMCTFELFSVYCWAKKRELALATLKRLDEFDISDQDRELGLLINYLFRLEEYELAREFSRRLIREVESTTSPPLRGMFLFSQYRRLLQILCVLDARDDEILPVVTILSKLAFHHYDYSGTRAAALTSVSVPLNRVPPSANVILHSVWAYMKCDEAFGGNHYQDDLAIIEAWLAQLSDRA